MCRNALENSSRHVGNVQRNTLENSFIHAGKWLKILHTACEEIQRQNSSEKVGKFGKVPGYWNVLKCQLLL